MSGSVAAGVILVLLVLCLGLWGLDLPTAISRALQLVLILAAALIGSKVNRLSKP
jgi:hypothetical protein